MSVVASRPCLSTDEVAAYVDGTSPAAVELERHVEACEACRQVIAATVRAARDRSRAAEGAETERTLEMSQLPSAAMRAQAVGTVPLTGADGFTQATLRDEEIRTARTMIRMGRALGLVAIAPLPLLGGNVVVQLVFITLVSIAIVVGFVVERRIRDPERYTERTMLALGTLVVIAGLSAMLYYGIFSAVQLFPVLALYFFSRRERFAHTLILYVLNVIGQALLAILVIGDVIVDPGMFEPVASKWLLVIGHLLIQTGHLAALLVGWHTRRDTLAAIENMQHAMLLAARRDVLLQEAQEELQRARRLGGAGRYTDQRFGSYVLGNVLGRGGMGEVYEARHVTTGADAAVKLVEPRELGNPDVIARFVREVRAVSSLRSPHVVRVLEASAEKDPIPYLVMERLRGHTLAELLREVPPPRQLYELLTQVDSALEEARRLGIVHRDLKPHNLFLADGTPEPMWKVLDFGLAALGDGGATLTKGHVLGTPAYMSPEQARGERVDHRADTYALAAIAYRWLTGRPVFAGADIHAMLYQIVHDAPPRPSSISAVHPDVDVVFAIGLAKSPGDRFASARELRDALFAALEGQLDPALRQRAGQVVVRGSGATAART